MTTKDGTRKRTPGGIFFVLVKQQLSYRGMRWVRWRAERRFAEPTRSTARTPEVGEASAVPPNPSPPEHPQLGAEPAVPAATAVPTPEAPALPKRSASERPP